MFTLHVTGLDATLDEYRRAHADLADFLVKIAYQELTTYDFLTSATVAYIPQSNDRCAPFPGAGAYDLQT